MEQLSRDDAIGFYRRFYAPNNAVVVIAGDVEPEAARKLAEETYGKVARHTNILPAPAAAGAAAGGGALADARRPARRAAAHAARLSGAVVRHRQAAASRKRSEVLAHILGSGSNSRLYRALVVDKHVAVMAGAGYDSFALDMSKFGVFGVPRPGVTLPQFEADSRRGDRRGDRARA